jgi:hypothetical protein
MKVSSLLYEKRFNGLMPKTEKTTRGFDEEEISVMLVTVARISAKLQNIKNVYSDPKDFAAKIMKGLKHRSNLAQVFFIYSFNDMNQQKLYSPAYFKNEISVHMRTNTLNDRSDILTASTDKSKTDTEYISSNDISKALKTLEKEIGLINISGKEKIKKKRGKQKVEFSGGRPSMWQLPPSSEGLKKLMSKPAAVELMVKSLFNNGLLPHLEFILEASFYVAREQARKRSVYEFAKISEKSVDHLGIKIDQQIWESHHNLMLSIPEDQLGVLAHRLSRLSINRPEACHFILLLALFISL